MNRLNKATVFVAFLLLTLLSGTTFAETQYHIRLKNGGIITTPYYYEEGQFLYYQKYGSTIGINKWEVINIEEKSFGNEEVAGEVSGSGAKQSKKRGATAAKKGETDLETALNRIAFLRENIEKWEKKAVVFKRAAEECPSKTKTVKSHEEFMGAIQQCKNLAQAYGSIMGRISKAKKEIEQLRKKHNL